MSRPGQVSWSRWLAGATTFLALVLGALALVAVTGPSSGAAARPDKASADAGFARDMAVHHQQAVELSFIVRDRTSDEDIRRLAYDIINTQANQRGILLGRLAAWDLPANSQDPPMAWMGHTVTPHDGALMPGMATNTQMDELRRAQGKAAEVLFLELLTQHHRAGIGMAQSAAEQVKDPVIKNLAEGMVRGQEAEVQLMADLLKQREPA
ncbi:DUF305 domain-containing protein [Streptomyces sp. NPDC050485]|uniref:DUF305 domain-containing protein n=1 Tax=Streptomyces sp. NPDC050485 TaxID=3365617 RepID=UPI0037AB68A0